MTPEQIRIIDEIIQEEGGWKYTDHPADPDKGTFAGVRYITWANFITKEEPPTPETFKVLCLDEDGTNQSVLREVIYQIYKEEYYDKMRLGELPPDLRQMVMSFGVNAGPARAIKELQRTVNKVRGVLELKIDGIIGSKTLTRVNVYFASPTGTGFQIELKQLQKAHQTFINEYIENWMRHYFSILNSTNFVFMHGWYNRANRYRRY